MYLGVKQNIICNAVFSEILNLREAVSLAL